MWVVPVHERRGDDGQPLFRPGLILWIGEKDSLRRRDRRRHCQRKGELSHLRARFLGSEFGIDAG